MRHKTPAMTRKYSHTFEDKQRAAIEALPDLTQPNRQSQTAIKKGTGKDISCSKSCTDALRIDTNMEGYGKNIQQEQTKNTVMRVSTIVRAAHDIRRSTINPEV